MGFLGEGESLARHLEKKVVGMAGKKASVG